MSKGLLAEFYTSFQQKDWASMQSCYHDHSAFSDPVFQNLSAKEAKAMWHMLLLAGKDLAITFGEISANEKMGSCRWEATYSFSKTGRKVHNIIEANFEFAEGKIFRHADNFDLWRWSGMALGWPGKLLGWSPLIRNKIRGSARKNLHDFIQKHAEYQ